MLTTTLRQLEFPAASKALMVTMLEPVIKGITADQLVVPAAVPDWPRFVDQVTCVTPTLSLAVPAKAMEVALVDTEVAPGVLMVNVGGVVSGVPVAGGVEVA